jgi:hypothetical protein
MQSERATLVWAAAQGANLWDVNYNVGGNWDFKALSAPCQRKFGMRQPDHTITDERHSILLTIAPSPALRFGLYYLEQGPSLNQERNDAFSAAGTV